MNSQNQAWQSWLEQLPPDQRFALVETVRSLNGSAAGPHAVATREELDGNIQVVYPSATDLLEPLAKVPPYVDINGLHAVYDRLMFQSNLLIKGPKGDGKTLSVYSWFAKNTIPLVPLECSEETKKSELIGSLSMNGDQVIFTLGVIPTAITIANETGQCGLVFEEINALPPPIQKMLNAILDFRKSVYIPQLKKTFSLQPGAKLGVAATMNPSGYGGTYDLNEDLKSRVEELEVGYPAAAHEMQILRAAIPTANALPDQEINNIVKLGNQTRQGGTSYSLSTRDLVRLAETIRLIGIQPALQMMLCKFEGDDREVVLKRVDAIWGPTLSKTMKKCWGSV